MKDREARNEIDALSDQFEHELREGQEPSIADFLEQVADPLRSSLFAELVQVDVGFRSERGELPRSADYLSRFPEYRHEIELAFSAMEPATMVGTVGDAASLEEETLAPGATVEGSQTLDAQQPLEFGDYEIIEEIARGGMGVVYKARQKGLNRTVALKMILSGRFAGEEEVQRFRAEAEAAANLDHPGIVPIYEVGERDGHHFFSMAFVEGQSLADMVSDGPLPPGEAARLTLRTVEAMVVAHENGVIHRDLKPANVLLDRENEPRVTDFGLAKQVASDSGLSATGQILGTPSYMPPEQAAGNSAEIDERADVYALGAILYCLLCGRPPFQAATPFDTVLQVLESDPVAPTQLNANVPRDLETVCLKCLAKEPQRRYQTAQALADELQRFLRHEPIQARPVTRVERLVKWCRRKPLVATLSGLVVALIVFVVIAAPIVVVREKGLRKTAESNEALAKENARKESLAKKDAIEARKTAEQLAESNRQQLVRMHEIQGDEQLHRNNLGHAFAWFARAYASDAEQKESRDASRDALHRFRLTAIWNHAPRFTQLWKHDASATHIALSSDGTRMVTTSHDRTARIFDLTTNTELTQPLQHASTVWTAAFSSDGNRVITAGGTLGRSGHATIWDVSSGKKLSENLPHNNTVFGGAFVDNDKRLVTISLSLTMRAIAQLWDVETGKKLASYTFRPGQVQAFSDVTPYADLPRKRFLERTDDRVVVSAFVGGSLEVVSEIREVFLMARFVGQGRFVLTMDRFGSLRLWDAATGEPTSPEIKPDGVGTWYGNLTAELNPRATRLTVAAAGRVLVFDVASGKRLTLKGESDSTSIYNVIGGNGHIVAAISPSGMVKIWDVHRSRSTADRLNHGVAVQYAVFSRDSRQLFTASADGSIRVWDLALAGAPTSLVNGNPPIYWIQFDEADDRILLGAKSWVRSVSGDGKQKQSVRRLPGSLSSVDWLVRSGKDSLIAGGMDDGTARLWRMHDGQPASPPLKHRRKLVRQVRLSSHGKYLATNAFKSLKGPDEMMGEVIVWDTQTHKQLSRLNFGMLLAGVVEMEFTPDGEKLVIAGGKISLEGVEGKVKVYDVDKKQFLATEFPQARGKAVVHVAIAPDQQRIATGAMEPNAANVDIRIFELASGRQIGQPIAMPDKLQILRFDPQGRTLLATTRNNQVHLYEAKTAKSICPPISHPGTLRSCRFNPDGTLLGTVCDDRAVRVFDARTGRSVSPPVWHINPVTDVQLTSDGRIVTGSTDGIARIWRIGADKLSAADFQRMARLLAGGDLDLASGGTSNSPQGLQQDWTALKQNKDVALAPSAFQILMWHHDQAELCENNLEYTSAARHRENELKILPDHFGIRLRCAELFATTGQYQRATTHYRRVVEAQPDSTWGWYQFTTLQLAAGDLKGYRASCKEMLKRLGKKAKTEEIERLVKICLLGVSSIEKDALPCKMIDRALLDKDHPNARWVVLSKAVAELRTGEHEQAVARLKDLTQMKNEPVSRRLVSLLVMALAEHKLGHSDKAKELVEQARTLRESLDDGHYNAWLSKAQADILFKELEADAVTR